MSSPITVSVIVRAPIEKVWSYWNAPEHVTKWNFASDDRECPTAASDLRVGGSFSAVMRAKDLSEGFEFGGTYTAVEQPTRVAYVMGGEDARNVEVRFEPVEGGVNVIETFDPENENAEELQRAGWQSILENFTRYVEAAWRSERLRRV